MKVTINGMVEGLTAPFAHPNKCRKEAGEVGRPYLLPVTKAYIEWRINRIVVGYI